MEKIENLEIRKIIANDFEAFWQLRLEALKNDPLAFAADYDEEKNLPMEEKRRRVECSENSFVVGAFVPQLIGILGFSRAQAIKLRHKGTISMVYVKPNFRGKGIARKLLNAALTIIKTMDDLEEVNLWVASESQAARALYLSVGFQIFGLESNALKVKDKYMDEELMSLKL